MKPIALFFLLLFAFENSIHTGMPNPDEKNIGISTKSSGVLFADSDSDGIDDSEDLDDDNDGIPDSVECGYVGQVFYSGFEASEPVASSCGGVNGFPAGGSPDYIPKWGVTNIYDGSAAIGLHPDLSDATVIYEVMSVALTTPLIAGQEVDIQIATANQAGTIGWGPVGTGYFNIYGGTSSCDTSQLLVRTSNRLLGAGWLLETLSTIITEAEITHLTLIPLGISSDPAIDQPYMNLDVLTITATDCSDSDGDGVINSLDLDSDNDGIPDIIEAGGTDSDGDGRVDVTTDTDGDGLVNTYDNDDTDGPDESGCTFGVDCDLSASTSSLFDTNADGTNDNDRDSDGDGYPNYSDIDSDNDGITDNSEAQSTSGFVAPSGTDTDGDGLDDAYDVDCSPCGAVTGVAITPVNTDGEADNPDYLDTDSDEDGESDTIEAYDTNDDGIADTSPAGTDSDGDGLDDNFDGNDLATAASTNPNENGETPSSFPDTDLIGGEPNWREFAAPLPIELLSFTLIPKKRGFVKIRWQTLNETNNDYFTVEKSADTKSWEIATTLKGAGNSDAMLSYEVIDHEPFLGSSYYRLKQTDFDGAQTYSPILETYVKAAKYLPIRVFPNPTRGRITLEGTPNELDTFAFYSISGIDVSSQVQVLERETYRMFLDLSKLPRGVYLLQTANETLKVRRK